MTGRHRDEDTVPDGWAVRVLAPFIDRAAGWAADRPGNLGLWVIVAACYAGVAAVGVGVGLVISAVWSP